MTVLDPNSTPDDRSDDRWAHLALPGGLGDDALSIAAGPDGYIWIGTSKGLWRLDHAGTPTEPGDDTWQLFDLSTGLPDEDIAALLPRDDGTVWVGTLDPCGGDGGGLALLDARDCRPYLPCTPIVTYTVEDGLLDDDVTSIVELPGGEVVLGSFNLNGAALVGALSGAPGSEDCEPPEASARTLGEPPPPSPTRVGRDGLAIIDPGPSLESKADDALTNL